MVYHVRRKVPIFVREFVSPSRRGSGYTPINAAINFLHSTRLLKCRAINARVGLGWDSGEGLLHNAKQKGKWKIGLLLDLSDPFKLADRETLLKVCLEKRITWKDFCWARGRQGFRFYYPRRETTRKLMWIIAVTDAVRVYYDGEELPLMAAYERFVSSFIEAIKAEDAEQLIPFICATAEEYGWIKELI